MTYSCSDFTGDILSRLDSVAVKPLQYDSDDPQSQANAALDAITLLAEQSDELLAALTEITDAFPDVVKLTPYGVPMAVSEIHDRAVAAIAKHKP